jgi:PHP family Zn ribbon phosphoesterase
LIDNFGNEINVLIESEISDIEKIDSKVSNAIGAFRNHTIDIIPGGGGKYGEINIKSAVKEEKKPKFVTLDNF